MRQFGLYEFYKELLGKGLDQFKLQELHGQARATDYQ